MKAAKWITALAGGGFVYWAANLGRWDYVFVTLPVAAAVAFVIQLSVAIYKRVRGPKQQPPVNGFSVNITTKDGVLPKDNVSPNDNVPPKDKTN